jgi:hypothetical protein
VLSAIDEQIDAHHAIVEEYTVNADVLKRNDDYVHYVLEYCEKNIDALTSAPPSWFQKAVQIADADPLAPRRLDDKPSPPRSRTAHGRPSRSSHWTKSQYPPPGHTGTLSVFHPA